MNESGDYTRRQAAKDAEYLAFYKSAEYLDWVASLSPAERRRLEADGLLKPMIDRSGSTLRDEDASESNVAAETPDFAATIDNEPAPAATTTESLDEKVMDVLRILLGEVLSQGNTRLTLECLSLACGFTTLQGESMTSLAKRHGVSRAAVSKRCVDITEKLNLPPSRSMRSKKARKIYRKAQMKAHRRNE